MKNLKKTIFFIALLIGTIIIVSRNYNNNKYTKIQGLIFGTVYNITYNSTEDLKQAIEAELKRFDNSLSTFNDSSVISKINRNISFETDSLMRNCFIKAMEISDKTDGAFDITVAPLVNAWGFGFANDEKIYYEQIDSLLTFVGYEKVRLIGNKIEKEDERTMLDCSSIAKGYAVDIISELLKKKGIKNYMVDIGGEVKVSGLNSKGEKWRIGVNTPIDDSLSVNNELQAIICLKDKAIATSGNYRNYYYKDGVKYAHTINPKTGYPIIQSILSATVIANECMTADAIATAFMVMGVDRVVEFCKYNKDIDAYIIYSGEDGKMHTFMSDGMKNYDLKSIE